MTIVLSGADLSLSSRPTIRDQIEDFAGRTLMLSWFLLALTLQVTHITSLPSLGDDRLAAFLDISHGVLVIAFSALAACLTIVRKPAKAVAAGLEPRVTAILGTFLLLTLPLLPTVGQSVDLQLIALPITTIGLIGSIYCLWWLGSSFAIMATARSLVTAGPYGVVRHPLYAAELVMAFGIVLWNLSWTSIAMFGAFAVLQMRRAYHEEQILREAFPEYGAYAKRVPAILPRLA